MATDPMKRLRESACELARFYGESANVSADVVAEYDDSTGSMVTHVTYSAATVIDGVKRHVHGSKSPHSAVSEIALLDRVEAMRADAKELGYGLVRLPDAAGPQVGK